MTNNDAASANKLGYVDLIRGIAVLGVLMIHTGGQTDTTYMPEMVKTVILNGRMGVHLFYFASAFTIFLSYTNRFNKEIHPVKNFFVRRFFRIAPLYYIAIVYYLWQDGMGPEFWTGGSEPITATNIASNFLFLHGFHPYYINSIVPGGWSIAVEMFFYILIPFLFTRVRNINQALYLLGITLIFRLVLAIFFKLYWQPIPQKELWDFFLSFYLPSQLPVFSIGIIFFFIVKGATLKDISYKPVLLLFSLIAVDLLTNFDFFFENHIKFAVAFLLLGIGLSKFHVKNLLTRLLQYIGQVSYSMYLVHLAVIFWLGKTSIFTFYAPTNTIGSIGLFIFAYLIIVIITLLISGFTYKYIELPTQKIGKRIIHRWEKPSNVVKTNQETKVV